MKKVVLIWLKKKLFNNNKNKKSVKNVHKIIILVENVVINKSAKKIIVINVKKQIVIVISIKKILDWLVVVSVIKKDVINVKLVIVILKNNNAIFV